MSPDQYPDDFELITAMQNAKARAEDVERYNDAVAGRETGYGNKHAHGEGRNTDVTGKGKNAAMAETLSRLQEWMQDADYAAAYADFGTVLARYETAAATGLAQAEARFADMLEHAVRLPDGRAIFRDKNGNAVDERGKKIDSDLAAGIIWPDDAPGYEEYRQRQKDIDDIRRYQSDVLGAARDGYEDETDPFTREDMDAWEKRLETETPELAKPKTEINDAPDILVPADPSDISRPQF